MDSAQYICACLYADDAVIGNNIPGKKVEPLNWAGGMPAYLAALEGSLENDYQGWKIGKRQRVDSVQ
jgi:hypothetical protein